MARKSHQNATETALNDEELPPMTEQRTVYAELLPSQSDAAQFDPDQEASFQDWADALGTERSGYVLRAYRLPMDDKGRAVSSGGSSIFLEAWPLDAVKYDDLLRVLRDEYMLPGMQTMAVRLMVSKDGERGVKKNQVIYVQRPLRGSTDTNHGKQESVTELLRAIQENSQAQMNQMREMMRPLVTQPAPAQRDPFEMMTMMMTAFGPIITAIAGRPQPAGSSLGDMVDVMIKMKELMPGGESNDSGGSDIINTIKAIVPLAAPVLTTFAANAQTQAAQATMQANSMNQPRRLSAPIQPVQTVNPVASEIAPVQPAEEMPVLMLQLKPQVNQLCEIAAQVPQPDPVQVAEMALANIPEQYDDDLGAALFNPKFMSWLTLLDGRVAQHQVWFNTVHETMKKAFAEEPGDGPAQ